MRFLVSLESAPGVGSPHTVAHVGRALAGQSGAGLSVRRGDRAILLDAALPDADPVSATRSGVQLFAAALERAGLPPEIRRARVVRLAG